MRHEYNEESFWAGVVVGTQLHGTNAYGVMPGWNPDSDLILRPITQGVPAIQFGRDAPFIIAAMVDAVEGIFPDQSDDFALMQPFGAVTFGQDVRFTVAPINERLVVDEVINAYSVDANINPLEYDEDVVFIDSSGAFTMDDITRSFESAPGVIDVGTMQTLTVTTEAFAEVHSQEVST